MTDLWKITEDIFDPQKQHHKETIFTIGNGYICTRGAFEEGYPGDRRATFAHGVFDAVPISITELANTPDWLPFIILLDDERFSLATGMIRHFIRSLDLRTGLLSRSVEWISPQGRAATITFERFTSLSNEHIALIRCQVTPDFNGTVEFRASLNGNTDNEGVAHWQWVTQGKRDETIFLHNRTRKSAIDFVNAMRLEGVVGNRLSMDYWDVENNPTMTMKMAAVPGKTLIVDKFVATATSRDAQYPLKMAFEHVNAIVDWPAAYEANATAWEGEWDHTDVVIEGDSGPDSSESDPAEAQIALRFNLFQMLIAAPRHDDRVNIGAKTLSGFGYRGHSFWDTEIFMLPLFIYTAPNIARNLLNYRYQRLPAARLKAKSNGYEGAQFPWESADTGEEVTPTWVPHFADRNKLVRIWTGDIEIHISADVALAAFKYWQITGDDAWMVEQGAELILDTAKFWASRAEWNTGLNRYEYNDVIGPDENHEHVNNNAYTNRMAQWNLQSALDILDWLKSHAPNKAVDLAGCLDLSVDRLNHWRDVIAKMNVNVDASGLIEQFEGFYQQPQVDLAAMEPRTRSVQEIYGIQEASHIQVLKQPDVLMMQYLLRDHYSDEQVRVNYDYYTPRTDHTYGSSLGPSIQAIMACEVGKPDDAYQHFMRAVRADLRDVRGNAGDGIHGASAAGTWQAVVFGFAGLRIKGASTSLSTSPAPGAPGWTITPRLPKGWKRVAFKFFYRGMLQTVDIRV
jgi:trehalose/maltose hydrolase-like predicted phosphorylase